MATYKPGQGFELRMTENKSSKSPEQDSNLGLPILGDPGADSGDEEKSKRAEKYTARRKVKNGEKSPWGQCLARPVPNGRRRSGF